MSEIVSEIEKAQTGMRASARGRRVQRRSARACVTRPPSSCPSSHSRSPLCVIRATHMLERAQPRIRNEKTPMGSSTVRNQTREATCLYGHVLEASASKQIPGTGHSVGRYGTHKRCREIWDT
eukprot:1732268-Rhodomonas_salina.2